ncbi:YciI family protein [Pelagibacterium sp. 26DY04]|uniref:YciI family protein n=1 Tax=Pelagibacterium sp. 26DY04 TaxID=2967130 RepID=UPI00281571F2|nr:YciI family protein [Pelagibacterium sp. 26DY04]WMT86883.1 YciI family protein [Pelagibacterium sp. 26DY04]
MRWAALFTDRTDGADIRAAHTEAHQAYLRKYKGRIALAGALRPEPGGAPSGGLWIFEAESRAEVEQIIAEDPFQIHGLRATSEVFAWGTAPGFEDIEIGAR